METVLGSLHEGEERSCCHRAAAGGQKHPEHPDLVLCSAMHLPERPALRDPAGSAPASGLSPRSASLSQPWDVSRYQWSVKSVLSLCS